MGLTNIIRDRVLLAILGLSILNISFSFFLESNIITYEDSLIYGSIAGVTLIGLYSFRLFKKESTKPFDYLKLFSIILIAAYPFIYLNTTEPWDEITMTFTIFIPLTIYIYDKLIISSATTINKLRFVTVVQTGLIAFLLLYGLIMHFIANITERERMADKELVDEKAYDLNKAEVEIQKLKSELENCR